MILGRYVKKPGEVGDYDIDLTPWLRQGETAESAVGTATCLTDAEDSSLSIDTVTVALSAIRVRLSGGSAGCEYIVTMTVTSSSDRTEDAEFLLLVEEPAQRLTYHDAYLGPLVTPEREQRALADVDEIAAFPAAWRSRLAVVRAYIITATESQRTVDDLFGARVKRYREEWSSLLPLARAAADAESGAKGAGSMISIPLERA